MGMHGWRGYCTPVRISPLGVPVIVQIMHLCSCDLAGVVLEFRICAWYVLIVIDAYQKDVAFVVLKYFLIFLPEHLA